MTHDLLASDFIANAFQLVQVSVLTGIFFRLGTLTATHKGFAERLGRIEQRIFGGD